MPIEKTQSHDVLSNTMTLGAYPTELLSASGRYDVQCFDAAGNLKWTDSFPNLVVNVGLQYAAGVALTSTAQITAWYIGLYGAGATNTPAAGDTMALHTGWTEIVPYSNATRAACTFAAATLANPSVATNAASVAVFNINASATVGGAFLVSNNTKSGSTGVLFSAADFTGGDRTVASGDTLNVTYTMSLAG